jgi:hypothetical protein
MNGNEIIELARKTYVDQFAVFARKLSAEFPDGAAEKVCEIEKSTPLYASLYRADFVRQADHGQPLIQDFQPDGYVTFDPLDGMAGGARVRMEQLCWDDVEITHDLKQDMTPVLKLWFEQWFDPDDKRLAANPNRQVDVIHAVGVHPGRLTIDFGTASTQAFWALIARLRDAGATSLTVRDTRRGRPAGEPA